MNPVTIDNPDVDLAASTIAIVAEHAVRKHYGLPPRDDLTYRRNFDISACEVRVSGVQISNEAYVLQNTLGGRTVPSASSTRDETTGRDSSQLYETPSVIISQSSGITY